jgi:uncharacterized membrane protein
VNSFVLGIIILVALQLWIPFNKRHENAAETTYTKDVQPIIQSRCSQCHNASVPERNWMDYNTAFKHRSMIKLRVENKTMPPGNSTGMTEDERKTIIKWVDDGGKK